VTIRNENYAHREIISRLNSMNAEYHLSSHLLSKSVRIKIYKTIISPVILYGSETWFEGVREKGADEDVCAYGVVSNERLEKTA
jgi:hypothetical protein